MIRTRSSVGACAALVVCAGAAFGQITGPSSSQSPYVLPSIPGVSTTSIFTVGDTVGGYRLVGIPDGMGALSNGDGTFSLLVNHELGSSAGVVRAHGQTGAFVSRWNINASAGNLVVNSGRDHNTSSADAFEYSSTTGTWSNAPSPAQRWGRFCSGDLAAPSAYRFGNLGTDSRIYMNGEEIGAEGRAYAHIVSGANQNQTWQLPHLGRFSWENAIASPYAQQKTVVVGTDDSTPGQVYMYVGDKQATGNDIERAGLTNGNLYGVRVSGLPIENRAAGASGRFDLFNHGNVANTDGATLQGASATNGVTEFLRPEDGAFDTRPGFQNDFYFVTTDRYDNTGTGGTTVGRSRLYRMRYDDITNPLAGGTVTMLLEGGSSSVQMMDNMCIDKFGRILIQEDIGGQDAFSKIWLYDTNSGGLVQVASHDAARFTPGAPGFLTRDEESSGIIDASDLLGDGWFLLNTQAHYALPGELVEGGQLMAMYVNPQIVPAPGALALLGVGSLLAGRRRRAR
jgi:hypothetical protein